MPAGIINTGSHPKLLWPGINAIWGQTYNEHKTEYTDLFEVDSSTRAYEEDVQVTGFGLAPQKPEGSAVSYDSETQGTVSRYTHLTFGLGYQVTMEELEDNLYEQVSIRRAKANAFSINQTVENFTTQIYNRAFNGSYTFADGKSLIATDHPFATGGTGSNALSPAADLSEASIEDLTIQMMGITTDRGLLISIMPRSLIVPRNEWYNANRIMKSVLRSGTANNDINVLKAENVFPEGVKLNHYLTAPHAWFIRTNCPDGMKMFWRKRPIFDQDNDFDTKNAKAATIMRLSAGVTDWRGLFGSNGP